MEKLIAQVAWSPVLSFHSLWWFGVQCHLLVLVHCVFLKTNVTAPVYQYILEHFMLPSANQLFKDTDLIFQQDLAPAHTAKSTKSWLNDHSVGVLDWPANSPDLNPIDNLWSIVKRKMRNKRPKNADELKATVKNPGLPYHLSSATNWSPPCHAELRQLLKQKEPLTSIEYIYNKLTYFPEGQQFTKKKYIGYMKYSNLLRVNWWVFVKCGFLLNVSQNHHN